MWQDKENGHTRSPLTQILAHIQLHLPGVPQSIQPKNATTTTQSRLLS